jgi:hypothetical protein
MEDSFASAAARFEEHYGWTISSSVIRERTLHHARQSQELPQGPAPLPAAQIITGLDGSMIPIMGPALEGDRRKNKTLFWREVRVAFARREGEVTARYGATLDEALGAGLMWHETAKLAGLHEQTKVHALGDGAPWILDQCDRQFGTRATFTVDFHHVSDYLAAAAPACTTSTTGPWFEEQKTRLRQNQVQQVLEELQAHQEPELKDSAGKTSPVRQAFGYIDQRQDHMDYRAALEAGLPIGSGEVESAHRHIVQARLKKAGAWWREPNAQVLLQMRTLRANDLWHDYWKHVATLN